VIDKRHKLSCDWHHLLQGISCCLQCPLAAHSILYRPAT